MEVQTNASYRFSDRLKGESRLELFNDYYLNVRFGRPKKQREFRMEVATLDPQMKKVEELAWHWIVAALTTLGAAAYFIYYLITSADGDEFRSVVAAILLLLGMSGGFVVATLFGSERKWVFETRSARYPLVSVPYDRASRQQAEAFAERLQQAIESNTGKKGYSANDLFAGEMRMLRRLAKSGIISQATYDSAKRQMLARSAHAPAA